MHFLPTILYSVQSEEWIESKTIFIVEFIDMITARITQNYRTKLEQIPLEIFIHLLCTSFSMFFNGMPHVDTRVDRQVWIW